MTHLRTVKPIMFRMYIHFEDRAEPSLDRFDVRGGAVSTILGERKEDLIWEEIVSDVFMLAQVEERSKECPLPLLENAYGKRAPSVKTLQ